jgi:hypothetical protein
MERAHGRRAEGSDADPGLLHHRPHGKLTLADRMLVTGLVEARKHARAVPRQHGRERERGITAQNVRLPWKVGGTGDVLDLIDTPGHIDFSYEVSRSRSALRALTENQSVLPCQGRAHVGAVGSVLQFRSYAAGSLQDRWLS